MYMKNEVKIPERTISIKIENKEYTINFPNTGELIDIETFKSSLSRGEYNKLSSPFATPETFRSKLLIDMVATFSILIPNLRKDLGKDISELDTARSIKILKNSYLKVFYPWYQTWTKFLSDIENEEDED